MRAVVSHTPHPAGSAARRRRFSGHNELCHYHGRGAAGMELMQGIIIRDLWIFFGLYWLVASLSVNKMRKREPWSQRLAFLLIFLVSCDFLMHAAARFGILNGRFVPLQPWIE